MAVETSLSVALRVNESITSENQAGPVSHIFTAFEGLTLANGTGAGQADKVWSDRRTLAGAASETLDLAGSLAPLFGAGTVTFAKVKIVALYNRSAAQILTYRMGAANGWGGIVGGTTDPLVIKPGGCVLWYDPTGTTVTAGTGDIILITNGAGSSCDYDIFVVGTSV